MNRFFRQTVIAVASVIALAACRREFDPKLYPNSDQLYKVALREYKARHWGNAVKAFEQLTRDLPARDPNLPSAYYYLGASQERQGDHLLAAQSFSRIADAFPEDSLAPQALLEAGLAYSKMWKKPELDPQHGQSALNTFQTLVSIYPESPLVPRANAEIARLDNLFALKDYSTGHHYFRRRAYDSAIIYFKDVIRLHPTSQAARQAYMELYESYRAIKYTDDAKDVCTGMLKAYPNDREVISTCGSASSAAASTPRT